MSTIPGNGKQVEVSGKPCLMPGREESRSGRQDMPGFNINSWSELAQLESKGYRISLCNNEPVKKKVISGFHALRQGRALVAGFKPAIEGFLQISGGLASLCATDTPLNLRSVEGEFNRLRFLIHMFCSCVKE
ncbi:hypothetical protein PoB_005882900 [Plakobranchus ocellatus]|uniref:Uncharacterized protein n=1 Tax=Plakobranchus ocellatus TaxID=259542 RepID=A0AAV4CMD8_9GAST|nr:hypothetical protein PoB_005882900 [Plakobranchus ocellatus]